MVKNSIEFRKTRYFKLSSQLAQIDDAKLRCLLEQSVASIGWGRNHILEIGQSKVFVKRIAVTQVEYDNMFSTKNLYELPTYYNYGIGSAGFGVHRELVAHIKTTNWVLAGALANFPLMYHYRFRPFSGARAAVDMESHNNYVSYWGNSENIGRYMLDRAAAPYELVLFLEHIPYELSSWLWHNPDKVERVLDDLRETITFLRKQGVIHFDAHYHNILTDGERTYLTDFGLVLDKSFDLSKEEASFFKSNTYYDYGEFLAGLDFLLYQVYKNLSDSDKHKVMQKYGIPEGTQPHEVTPLLRNNIEAVAADGIMSLDANYIASIIKYRSVIELMRDFYVELGANFKKDTKFRNAELRRRLKATRFLSSPRSKH